MDSSYIDIKYYSADDRIGEIRKDIPRFEGAGSSAGNRVACRTVSKWVTELEIESNEAPLLLQRSLDDPIVAGRAEALLVDCRNVVASSFEEGTRQAPKVLVELELQ